MPPLIDLGGVSRRYEHVGIQALTDVTLRVGAGEFVCVTGHSGSGKSTLLNILGGLDRPTGGVYRLGGIDVASLDPDNLAKLRCSEIGFVFQAYNLVGFATLQENVELPGYYLGKRPSERRTRARAILESFGLGERLAHLPAELSGGEQQRAAIARAVANGPQVILADEPTGALDSALAEEILTLFRDLSDRGHAVVVASHDPRVAAYARRRIELKDGRVVADTGSARGTAASSPKVWGTGAHAVTGDGRTWSRVGVIREAAKALRGNLMHTNRVSTSTTALSVAVGLAALTTLLGVLGGAARDGAVAISQLGGDEIRIHPWMHIDPIQLSVEDAEALRGNIGNVRQVNLHLGGPLTVRYGSRQLRTGVVATDGIELETNGQVLERGLLFTGKDSERLESVAVLGPLARDALFAAEVDPLGKYIFVGDHPFLVKGVLGHRPTSPDEDTIVVDALEDRRVYIPFGIGRTLVFGDDGDMSMDVLVEDPGRIEETASAIRDLLIRRHTREGFRLVTDAGGIEKWAPMRRLFEGVLAAVGGFMILLGGTAIMSMMLMSVRRRSREIAVRIAVGGRRTDIFLQFLLETGIVLVVGGVLGLLLGVAVCFCLLELHVPIRLSSSYVLAVLGVAVAIGFFFGVLPARRAARVDPVATLGND